MLNDVINWLLEDDNPAVKYRTQTELLDMPKKSAETEMTRKALLSSDLMKSVMALFDVGKNFSDSHALSALAEYGLTRDDVDIDSYVNRHIINTNFRDGCGEGFLLRNLVALGYTTNQAVINELPLILAAQQSDGGYPCISNNPKIKKPCVPHKSCFQMTASYLLLAAEMFKKGVDCPQTEGIVNYFLCRDVLYRHDDPNRFVKDVHATTFHPPVCIRIGLHMILCALSVLGKGSDPGCKRAWEILSGKCDVKGRNPSGVFVHGKYILDGSLTKPYLKIEKPGKPSKWVTFYSLLAKKERDKL
ncbi:MAG: hypothetical protein FWE82_04305 [Defluviitaleaceae bacterium]|nr:hypothetical protein [Defluviitaleaceae bacterium]